MSDDNFTTEQRLAVVEARLRVLEDWHQRWQEWSDDLHRDPHWQAIGRRIEEEERVSGSRSR